MCRFFLKPDGCRNGDNCEYAHPRTNGKCLRCGSESHNLQACTRPRRQQSSRSESVKPASKKTYAKPKGKAADHQGSQEKKKSKGKSKGKGSQTKPTAKSGDVNFDDDAPADQADQDDDQAPDEPQEDDPEACLIAAATSSSDSEVETDGMCDWSASECKDYKVGIATVARIASESTKIQRDTWEWRGPCCLVRAHPQLRRCLFTPTWKEDIGQGLTVQPQRITHVKPQDQSFLSSVIEHVKSVEYLKPRKVSYPWTGEVHFRVTPAACGNNVFRTTARILVPVSDMNPMAIADSGASLAILPQSALFDSKSSKPVNLRPASGEVQAVEAHREIFAEHVTIPLSMPVRTSHSETTAYCDMDTSDFDFNCVNKAGTAQGLMQCPIKGDTPYFTAVQFWMLRRAL